ncbi:MAG: DUF2703 domain-containing protein [Sulfuricella sp.]|nr:DUF2703 domain-containing protein [Sulfuricella sp.]
MGANKLDIEWRHLEVAGNTCERCDATGKTLGDVLKALSAELKARGVEVVFCETPLGAAELAQSNLILFNGRPLEEWLNARTTQSHCQSCCEMVGEQVNCRAVEIAGKVYEAIPEALIRDAAYAALGMEKKTMREIKVLGSGCANCNNTVKLIEETAKEMGEMINLEKITDMAQILAHGVMSTPGVMVDGWLVHSGGVPTKAQVQMWLSASADSCGCGDEGNLG